VKAASGWNLLWSLSENGDIRITGAFRRYNFHTKYTISATLRNYERRMRGLAELSPFSLPVEKVMSGAISCSVISDAVAQHAHFIECNSGLISAKATSPASKTAMAALKFSVLPEWLSRRARCQGAAGPLRCSLARSQPCRRNRNAHNSSAKHEMAYGPAAASWRR
jgi:hypothetical protein